MTYDSSIIKNLNNTSEKFVQYLYNYDMIKRFKNRGILDPFSFRYDFGVRE